MPVLHALRAKPATNFWNGALLVAALGVIAYGARAVLVRLARGQQGDFYHFYEAARAVRSGTDLYESGSGGYLYPPLFAFLLGPIADLPLSSACALWLGVNVLLIALILYFGFRVLQKGFVLQCTRWQAVGVCSLAVLLGADEVRAELSLGQSDTVTLLGAALGLFWLERWPLAAGAALGAAANVKYQTVAIMPYLLCRGRFWVSTGLVLGFVGCALLPAIEIGWGRNLEYLSVAFNGMARMVGIESGRGAGIPDVLWTRSVSITSGVARVCVSAGWPASYALPVVVAIMGIVGLSFWAMFQKYQVPFLWRDRRASGSEARETGIVCLEWCVLLTGLSVFSPQGTKRHLFLILTTQLVAAMILWLPRPGTKRGLLIAGVVAAEFGLRLPLKEISVTASDAWNFVGGPSWCALLFLLCTVRSGLAYWQQGHSFVENEDETASHEQAAGAAAYLQKAA